LAKKRILWFGILLLLVSGCTQALPQTNSDANYPVPTKSEGYDPGYPIDTSKMETATVPSVVPNTGLVYGVIEYNGKPLPKTTFFLADVLEDEKGKEIATSLDRVSAPMSVTDANGLLKFYNVKPGRYGLILAEGMNTYLLLYPDTGEAILITVRDGGEIDLGLIKFTDLPID